MTIITSDNHTTQVRFSNNVERVYSQSDDKFYYKIELPTVLCDNEESARKIQSDINTFVNKRISSELNSLEIKEKSKETTKQKTIEVGKFSNILNKMDKIRKEEKK